MIFYCFHCHRYDDERRTESVVEVLLRPNVYNNVILLFPEEQFSRDLNIFEKCLTQHLNDFYSHSMIRSIATVVYNEEYF